MNIDEINKSLTRQVHLYNSMRIEGAPAQRLDALFSKIEPSLETLTYFLPQLYLGMDQEDASDFLLELMPKFRKIICKFEQESNDFCAFFFSVLKVKTRAFNFSKAVDFKRENLVLNSFDVSSIWSPSEDFEELEVAENHEPSDENSESDGMKRLKYALKHSPTARRRFCIYILSISPFIDALTLSDICNLARLNYPQMMVLTGILTEKCQEIFSEKERLIEARNLYYTRKLEVQNAIDDLEHYGADTARNQNFLNVLNARIDRKNFQIDNLNTHVPYKDLADLLNINSATVSSQIFYARKLVSWCCQEKFDIESNLMDFAFGTSLARDIIFEKWKYENLDKNFTEFSPVKEFNIKLELEDGIDTKP